MDPSQHMIPSIPAARASFRLVATDINPIMAVTGKRITVKSKPIPILSKGCVSSLGISGVEVVPPRPIALYRSSKLTENVPIN